MSFALIDRWDQHFPDQKLCYHNHHRTFKDRKKTMNNLNDKINYCNRD